MSKSRRKRRLARFEMTPLMDVMFLVLVFFVFAASFMAVHRGVRVDLPDAAGEREMGERIVIAIRSDDTMQLNGRDMPRQEIVRRVKALVGVKQSPRVLISGDRSSSLGSGIELLQELKNSGVEQVSFSVKGAPR